jgi:hypothetical protein
LFGRVRGEFESTLVGGTGLVWLAECAQELGACGVIQVVQVELAGESVQLDQRGLRSGNVAQGNRSVQAGDWRRRQVQKHVVEQQDLLPVGLIPMPRLCVTGNDGGLELVRAGSALLGRALEEADRSFDQSAVPLGSVLVFQQNQGTARIEARVGSGAMEPDKGEEPADLRLRRHQLMKLFGEPLGIVKEVARLSHARGRQIAFVQEQVDHCEDLREARTELVRIRDPVRDACLGDLSLGSGDALGDGGLWHDEGLGLAANALAGWWWMDALAGLAVAALAVREGIAAWRSGDRQVAAPTTQQPSFGHIFLHVSWKDRALFSVSQAGLVNNLNDGMVWGLFPLVFAASGLTLEQVGVLAATCLGVWGIARLGTGALSDRLGRKGLIVGGMWVQAVGILLVIVTEGFGAWATGMVLLGFGTALVYPTLLAAISDVAHPEWRASAVGVYRLWRDGGYAVGALLAGVLADLAGVPFAIGAVAALTFGSGVIVLLRMYETLPGHVPGSQGTKYVHGLTVSTDGPGRMRP